MMRRDAQNLVTLLSRDIHCLMVFCWYLDIEKHSRASRVSEAARKEGITWHHTSEVQRPIAAGVGGQPQAVEVAQRQHADAANAADAAQMQQVVQAQQALEVGAVAGLPKPARPCRSPWPQAAQPPAGQVRCRQLLERW